jgi:hypothetical protein
MKKLLLPLLLTVVLAGVASAEAGNPIQRDRVIVRIATPPTFLGPTPKCQALRSHAQLQSVDGGQLGTSLLCVQEANFDERTGIFTEVGSLTLYLPGGTIETAVTIADDFAEFPTVVQTLAGVVTEGTGAYLGASGSIIGGGMIVLGADGPQPDLIFTIEIG